MLKKNEIVKSKEIEKLLDYKINKENYIIRLDWKWFSKFTKQFFEKPYDKTLDSIFQKVTEELFKDFKIILAYTQSDEITLYFDKTNIWFYNNRIQKIISLIASKTTALFIKELHKHKLFEAAEVSPIFDARIFEVNNLQEVYKSFEFRYFDCLRNSKLNLSMFLSKKDRLYKSWNEIIELIKNDYSYYDLPLSYRKWTFFIKEEKLIENPLKKYYKWQTIEPFITRKKVKIINIDNFPLINEFKEKFWINL